LTGNFYTDLQRIEEAPAAGGGPEWEVVSFNGRPPGRLRSVGFHLRRASWDCVSLRVEGDPQAPTLAVVQSSQTCDWHGLTGEERSNAEAFEALLRSKPTVRLVDDATMSLSSANSSAILKKHYWVE
jgi:hypothetical protein